MNRRIYIFQIEEMMDPRIIAFILSASYLLLSCQLTIIKVESIALITLYNTFLWITPQTRRLMWALTIFIIFAVLYDFMRVFPNYLYNKVDITDIYNFEKAFLGLTYNGTQITLNEYFSSNNSPLLDIIAGVFYLNWMPVPLAFAIYLYFKNKKSYLHFSLAFLFVNIIGFSFYYIYPAAPPWYIALNGFNFDVLTKGNAAGFERFDELINLSVFKWIYGHNSNVFAAVPSLHCAYPVIVLYHGIENKLGNINWLLGIFMIGIWFSAVYSGHHYVVDVLLGVLCAIVGLIIHEVYLSRQNWYKNFINKYLILLNSK